MRKTFGHTGLEQWALESDAAHEGQWPHAIVVLNLGSIGCNLSFAGHLNDTFLSG